MIVDIDELKHNLLIILTPLRLSLQNRTCLTKLKKSKGFEDSLTFIANLIAQNSYIYDKLSPLFRDYLEKQPLLRICVGVWMIGEEVKDETIKRWALEWYLMSFMRRTFLSYIPHCDVQRVLSVWETFEGDNRVKGHWRNSRTWYDLVANIVESTHTKWSHDCHKNFVYAVNSLREHLRTFVRRYKG